MALSLRATRILWDVKDETRAIVNKMGLVWDAQGDRNQHFDAIRDVAVPLLLPHIEAGVKLSYSLTNSIDTPSFNIAWDISQDMLERARAVVQEEKRKQIASKHKTLISIKFSTREGLLLASVHYTVPGEDSQAALKMETFDQDDPASLVAAQAKILTEVAEWLKPSN